MIADSTEGPPVRPFTGEVSGHEYKGRLYRTAVCSSVATLSCMDAGRNFGRKLNVMRVGTLLKENHKTREG